MKTVKDTEYVSLSAWVRTQENKLLTRERRDRMTEAATDEEWVKLFTECGYPEPAEVTIPAVNAVLSRAREELFAEVKKHSPQEEIVSVLQVRYDYHNAKTVIKAKALGEDPVRLLAPGGRYPAADLLAGFEAGAGELWTETFAAAVDEASVALAETGDPQQCDLILDRACYEEMTAIAASSGSAYLQGYTRLSVDAVNLRAMVRCARMELGEKLLAQALLPGGNVSPEALLKSKEGELARLYRDTPLASAAALGMERMRADSGALSGFERAIDNALTAYLASAKRIAFGEQPVVGYLCAREAEATAIRTILSGRKAGLSGEAIRERLRESYV